MANPITIPPGTTPGVARLLARINLARQIAEVTGRDEADVFERTAGYGEPGPFAAVPCEAVRDCAGDLISTMFCKAGLPLAVSERAAELLVSAWVRSCTAWAAHRAGLPAPVSE